MSSPASADIASIRCPKCKAVIKLTDAVAGPLLESARAQFETDLTARLAAQRTEIESAALAKARADAKEEVDRYSKKAAESLQDLYDMERKLKAAQEAEAAAVRKERELAGRERELELTIERRVSASVTDIRNQANLDAAANAQLKIAEAQETIASMSRTIEDLKRKAEQGSQQMQGEVQELALEAMLTSRFPTDTIEPVAKGQFGGDCLQKVVGPSGQPAGSILWESKRTKAFSPGWLVKLREDQRAAKAEVAVLVTQAMPTDAAQDRAFDMHDGIWVVSWKHAETIAVILRHGMFEVAGARTANEGIETKAKQVYKYLTGPVFRQQVQAVIEKSAAMKDGLEKERRAMTRIWSEREVQIDGVIKAMAGMYGNLQGIAGKGLAEVEGLQLPAAD